VATGPLTSERFSRTIAAFTGADHLYFYDAISPIVDARSLDMEKIYTASRYNKGGDDYLNCPMNQEEYDRLYEALTQAASIPVKEFEKSSFFEACLPLEELARRGRNTLVFGPLKPVGLVDPRTGRRPFAVLQLRKENLMADSYNLVGCQNHMKFGDQQRVFRLVPGLEHAEFLRYGQVHRNTYIDAPRILLPTLQTRLDPRIFFAGQIAGVEGYVECMATGLVAGINAGRLASGSHPLVFPPATACGSLCRYLSMSDQGNFQPMNMTFGLLPPFPENQLRQWRDKKKRRQYQVQSALQVLRTFQAEHSYGE
jgi:methylenetetrahydrofolate--tRNA-(uracil-5-)-methyltransferase